LTLASGTRFGAYDILSLLGSGGMGEVYRAKDTKLNRDVALKILPDTFTHDSERLARFRREAQVLAALNHPHIGAIYGLDEANGQHFLVLELVDGESLDRRIARGPIPIDEALVIAKQIAEALEAAHEKGIVHRDLKPANIALTPDGTVKVLDFGLAKATEPPNSGAPAAMNSPTITTPAMMTGVGMILGTAGYMSPEQAKGRPADKRSDIWAFGCVLYEMLTGRRAFDGEDITDTIAAIMRDEPDWTALPRGVPESTRILIKRCVEKDRRSRIGDIAVARFLLSEDLTPAFASPAAPRSDVRRTALALAGGVFAGVVMTGAAWSVLRSGSAAAVRPAPVRFATAPAELQTITFLGGDRDLDVSADGATIVYRGAADRTQPHLYVRRLDELEGHPLTGTLDARSPAISPDGQWVAFLTGDEMKKVSIAGGSPVTLCHVPPTSRGTSWGPDGSIVFGAADRNGALLQVPDTGGEPQTLLAPDPAHPDLGGRAYDFPSVLPGGKAVLFTIGNPGASPDVADLAQVAVLDRRTGQRRVLIRGGSQPRYINGYLVYGSAGILRAVRFDLDRLAIVGEPVPVVERVLTTSTGALNFAVSSRGTLVYVPAGAVNVSSPRRSMVWVNRQGREETIPLPPRAYADPRISPDGTRIAVGIRDQRNDIWIAELTRQTLTRLTFDPAMDQDPVWTPDGLHIVWSSQRGVGVPNLFMQAADGTGTATQLTANSSPSFATSISPDGAHAIFWQNTPRTAQDVIAVDIAPGPDGRRRLTPLVQTNAVEMDGELSADGRWLAYESNESGQSEIFVRPYPNVDGGRWQVSNAGGTRPAWARSGHELFYLDAGGLLTSVPIRVTGTTFGAGQPTTILRTKYFPGFTGLGLDLRGYDVSADAQRFLMVKDVPEENLTQRPSVQMVVVLNWFEELKARVPTK